METLRRDIRSTRSLCFRYFAKRKNPHDPEPGQVFVIILRGSSVKVVGGFGNKQIDLVRNSRDLILKGTTLAAANRQVPITAQWIWDKGEEIDFEQVGSRGR